MESICQKMSLGQTKNDQEQEISSMEKALQTAEVDKITKITIKVCNVW